MRHLFSVVLCLLLPNFAFGAKHKPAPSYASGAPVDAMACLPTTRAISLMEGASVRLSFMLRRFGTYFRSGNDAPKRVENDEAQLQAPFRELQPAVTWIGHSTTLVQIDGINFLTDPIWSKRPSPVPLLGPRRYVPPGVALEDLPVIDFVVISHNHYDHLDVPTLKALAQRNPQTVFFVPLGNGELLRNNRHLSSRGIGLGPTSRLSVAHGTLSTASIGASALTDTNRALWASWAVTSPKRRIYYAGDSGYFSGFTEIGDQLGPFDLAIVPIGAYAPRAMMLESHMNPEEAYQSATDVGASKALGVHFGTFDLSDEPLAEPPRRFLNASSNAPAAAPSPWILRSEKPAGLETLRNIVFQ